MFCKIHLLHKKSGVQEVSRPSELTPASKCLLLPIEYVSIEIDALSALGESLRAPETLLIPIIYHIGVAMFSQSQVKTTRQQRWGSDWNGLKEQRTEVGLSFSLGSDTCDRNVTKIGIDNITFY